MLILDQLVAQKLVLYTYVARHAPAELNYMQLRRWALWRKREWPTSRHVCVLIWQHKNFTSRIKKLFESRNCWFCFLILTITQLLLIQYSQCKRDNYWMKTNHSFNKTNHSFIQNVSIYIASYSLDTGLSKWCSGKEYTCQCRRHQRCGFHPCVGKIHCRRKWQPTPVVLPRPVVRIAWRAIVHGVAKSRTRQGTWAH